MAEVLFTGTCVHCVYFDVWGVYMIERLGLGNFTDVSKSYNLLSSLKQDEVVNCTANPYHIAFEVTRCRPNLTTRKLDLAKIIFSPQIKLNIGKLKD